MKTNQSNLHNNSISMGQTIIDKTTDPVLDKNNIDEVISNINTKVCTSW